MYVKISKNSEGQGLIKNRKKSYYNYVYSIYKYMLVLQNSKHIIYKKSMF